LTEQHHKETTVLVEQNRHLKEQLLCMRQKLTSKCGHPRPETVDLKRCTANMGAHVLPCKVPMHATNSLDGSVAGAESTGKKASFAQISQLNCCEDSLLSTCSTYWDEDQALSDTASSVSRVGFNEEREQRICDIRNGILLREAKLRERRSSRPATTQRRAIVEESWRQERRSSRPAITQGRASAEESWRQALTMPCLA